MSTMREAVVRFTAIDRVSAVASRMASNVENSLRRAAGAQSGAAAATQRSAEQWQQYGRGMDLAGRGMMQTGAILSGVLTAGITTATMSASSMEDAFVGVQKVTNMTDQEYVQLERTIMNMSKRIPSSFEEIAGTMEVAGRLGIEGAANLETFTETMLMMGVATEMSAEEAADSMARFMNIMGTSTSDVDRLGATIVDLGNNFATTEPEILNMGLRLAGSAKQLGLTEAETLGLSAAMSALGLRAEMGGSAMSKFMNKAFTEISEGGEQAAKWADIAGVSFEELSSIAKDDMAGALQLIIEGFGRMGEEGENLDAIMRDMGINDVRMLDTLKRLSSGYGLVEQAISLASSAWEENTALIEEAELRYDTFSAQLQMFINRMRNIIKPIGEAFKEVFNEIFQAIAPVTEKIEEFMLKLMDLETGAVTPLGKALAILAIALTVVFAALIPLGFVVMLAGQFLFLANSIGLGIGLILRITTAFSLLLGGLITTALGVIVFREELAEMINEFLDRFPMVRDVIDGVVEKAKELWEKFQPLVSTFLTFLPLVTLMFSAFMMLVQAKKLLAEIAYGVWLALQAVFLIIRNNPITLLILAIGALVAAFITLWNTNEDFREAVEELWGIIKNVISTAVDYISEKVMEVYGALAEWWGENNEEIKESASEAWESLQETVTEAIETVAEFVREVWGALVEWWNENNESIKESADEAWTSISEFIMPIVEEISEFIQDIWGIVSDFWVDNNELMGETVETVWNAIWDTIGVIIQQIEDKMVYFTTIILPAFGEAWETIKTVIKLVWEFIKVNIKNTLTFIAGILEATMHAINGDWEEAWNTIKETFSDIWDNIKEFFGNTIDILLDHMSGFGERSREYVSEHFGFILEFLVDTWNNITTAIAEYILQILIDVRVKFEEIKQNISDKIEAAKEAVKVNFELMKKLAIERIVEILTNVITKFQEIKQNISDRIEEAKNALVEKFGEMYNNARDKVTEIWTIVRDKFEEVKTIIRDKITEAKEALVEKFIEMVNNATEKAQEVYTAISDKMSEIPEMVGGFISDAVQAVKDKFSEFKTAGSNIVQSIADGISGAVGKVTDAIGDVTSKIREFLPFSPAKKGALRDIMKTNISGSIAETIRKGQKEPINQMSKMAKGIRNEMDFMGNNRMDLDINASMRQSSAEMNRSISADVNSHIIADFDPVRPIVEVHNHGDLEMIRTEIHERDAVEAMDLWANS